MKPPFLAYWSREETLGAAIVSFCFLIMRLWDSTAEVVEKALRPLCRVYNLAVIVVESREKISRAARRPTILEEGPMAGFRLTFYPGALAIDSSNLVGVV